MFEKLISKLGQLLSKNKIPYMIIGGQAVLLYGTPRLTKGIDIILGVSTDRMADIVRLCRSAKFKILPENYKDFVSKTFVLPVKDKVSEIRIDFIFSFTPYEHQAIARSKKVKIGSVSVNFASVEDVIIHKIFAGRPRDIEDTKNIILKNSKMNIIYIKKWLSEFEKTFKGTNYTGVFKKVLNEMKRRH
ncbi:MAG: nucleotidyltransferase [Nitrospirota bacterium]